MQCHVGRKQEWTPVLGLMTLTALVRSNTVLFMFGANFMTIGCSFSDEDSRLSVLTTFDKPELPFPPPSETGHKAHPARQGACCYMRDRTYDASKGRCSSPPYDPTKGNLSTVPHSQQHAFCVRS